MLKLSRLVFCPRLCAGSKAFGITGIEGGFPHSEILGSKLVRSSPRLIAAYHVLHRLLAPRHQPNALLTLDSSHYRRPPPSSLGRDNADRSEEPDDDRKDHFLLRTHPRMLRSSGIHCDNRSSSALIDVLADALPRWIGCVSSSQC